MKVTYKKYQELLKEHFNIKVVKHSDFIEKLFRLDKKVNDTLPFKKDYNHSTWTLKRLELDNFLSYGDGNVIDFTKLNGLTLIPGQNQIGKTQAIKTALTFLLFNKSDKTSKQEEFLNVYRNKDSCKVKGYFIIDNQNYIIEREVIRKYKKDRTSFICNTNLNFYKELKNGEIENLNGDQRQSTEKVITDNIGTFEDFVMTILIDGDGLCDIIELKPTYRLNLLTRFLGLEIFKIKEDICKNIFNEWKTTLKSNLFDISILKQEINNLQEQIKIIENELKELMKKLSVVNENLMKIKGQKDKFLSSLHQDIDDILTKSDPLLIDKKIKDLELEIKNKKINIEEIKKQINIIKGLYVKQEHEKLIKELNETLSDIKILNNDINKLKTDIKNFEEGKICQLCKRPFENKNHSKEIKELQKQLKNKELNLKEQNEISIEYSKKLNIFEKQKEELELKDRLILTKDRNEIELESIDLKLNKEKNNLENYHKNINKINQNIEINKKVREIDFQLYKEEQEKEELSSQQKEKEYLIKENNKKMEEKISIGKEIKKEQQLQKVFISYLSLMGKNGLSKMILMNYIPTINNELDKLLSDTTNFGVQIDLNLITQELGLFIRDNVTGVIKPLKSASGFEKTMSSLALRIVLNKINCLCKPNILILDEILGKVSEENLSLMSDFFEKLKTLFNNIFLITHNEKCKDFSDSILTIEKDNNISKIYQN